MENPFHAWESQTTCLGWSHTDATAAAGGAEQAKKRCQADELTLAQRLVKTLLAKLAEARAKVEQILERRKAEQEAEASAATVGPK